MPGIDFIGPDPIPSTSRRAAEVSRIPGLPRPYGKENLLSTHLINACFYTSLELSTLGHVNPESGEAFNCLSYYSDDQKDTAISSKEDFGYLTTMSAPFVRRLVKISNRLAPAMARRPRASKELEYKDTGQKLQPDPELKALLEGDLQVSEAEALEIVSQWPAPEGRAQLELGDYTLFYDMIRLIWIHEWAHALTGHVALMQNDLGFSKLNEFSTERAQMISDDADRFPRNEVLQAIELHADEFALRRCLQGILWGYDPVANMAGPSIDLVDRLLMFNVACCVFTVIWALSERKYSPDDTFRPPRQTSTPEKPAPIFVTTRSTHPPGVLRYDTFRGHQRDITTSYGLENGHPQFGAMVDAYSLLFLETLAELSGYFLSLQAVTPMIARTPTQKVLEAYSNHMMEVSLSLVPRLQKLYYLPTVAFVPDEDESS